MTPNRGNKDELDGLFVLEISPNAPKKWDQALGQPARGI